MAAALDAMADSERALRSIEASAADVEQQVMRLERFVSGEGGRGAGFIPPLLDANAAADADDAAVERDDGEAENNVHFSGTPAETASLLAAADAENATAVSGAAPWQAAAQRFGHMRRRQQQQPQQHGHGDDDDDNPTRPPPWPHCRARFRAVDRERKRAALLDERLTRLLIDTDAVQGVSREAVRNALREHRTADAKRISALVGKRKHIVQRCESLAGRLARAASALGVARSSVANAAAAAASAPPSVPASERDGARHRDR